MDDLASLFFPFLATFPGLSSPLHLVENPSVVLLHPMVAQAMLSQIFVFFSEDLKILSRFHHETRVSRNSAVSFEPEEAELCRATYRREYH